MKKILILYIFLFSIIFAEKTYKCGVAKGYPPYQYADNNKIIGFDVDIASEVFKRMGKKIEFYSGKWEDVVAKLYFSDELDLVCGMETTTERIKRFSFSIPYYERRSVIFVLEEQKDINNICDLIGKNIVGDKDSHMEEKIDKLGLKKELRIKQTVSKEKSFELLENKNFEAAIARDFEEAVKKTESIMNEIKQGNINKEEISEVMESTIENILMDSNIALGLLEGKEGHDYVFKHALNTVVIAIIIGNALGYNKKQLDTLGKGALLHDIGMLKVDEAILRKEEELTPEDIEAIEKHTIYGYEALKDMGEEIAQIAKYHQERIDGSGYPEGLKGDEIPEMAKIVAIADMYTALTEDRRYRSKYENYDAMKIVMQSSATKMLDHKILKIFLEYMPIYPINSYVILNNNQQAKVVKANKNPFRPVVDIEESGKVIRIDLVSEINATKYIVGVPK